MSKAQYDIYRRKVYDLAETLVVKSSATADAINRELSELGHAVSDIEPSTWKYYLNLAGRYHAFDTVMTVTSQDTLQTIDFTRENLQVHLATARAYQYGSRYYNELVSRYPTQENLIRGILNPVDINTAIAAEDGEILYYDPDLVESNETNLIPRLSEWCRAYMVRWNVAGYTLTDDLYAAAQLAIMFMNIPLTIINIRLSNCHTQYAHSFHIREFLASHGRLDVYVDNLTKKQMLWLYRNARYLHRNAGKQETFQTLIQNVLTDRGLPLAEWNMRHRTEDQAEDIYPEVEFVRNPLNFGYSSAGADTRNVIELLTAEQPVAKGNARVQYDAETIVTEMMENSINDRLATKVLESSVLDLTDATPFTLSDTLLNHWLYLSAREQYKAVITVDNPKTGGTLTLTVTDAFVVFLYAYNAARGLVLPEIPLLEAIMVRRLPTPTKAQIRTLVDPRIVSDAVVDKAYENLEPIGNIISTEAFHEQMVRIHARLLDHRNLWATREHFVERGMVEQMSSHLYCDYKCDLGAGTSYTEWFAEKGLDIPSFSELEADLLATQILSHATGTNLTIRQSLKDMQGAMLRLMAQLSSYSIQFLQSINSDPIKVIDWPLIRPGEADIHAGTHIQVNALDVYVQEVRARGRARYFLHLDDIGVETDISVKLKHHLFQDISLEWKQYGHDVIRERVPIADIRIMSWDEPVFVPGPDTPDDETESYVPIGRTPLEDAFLSLRSPHYALTALERQTIIDRWQEWEENEGEMEPPLSAELTQTTLPGIEYPDFITMPERILPGFEYPDGFTFLTTDLPGHTYPDEIVLGTTVLSGLDFPSLAGFTITDLPGHTYPTMVDIDSTDLPGFIAPVFGSFINNTNLPGIEYPELHLFPTVVLPGFEYPPLEFTMLQLPGLRADNFTDIWTTDLSGFTPPDLGGGGGR